MTVPLEDEGKIIRKVSRNIGNVTDETNFTLEFGLAKGVENAPVCRDSHDIFNSR